MSKRRQPGERIQRAPGSGFVGSAEPRYLLIPSGKKYDYYTVENPDGEAEPCMLCEDSNCREWANLEIAEGPHQGQFMFHVSECQMDDATV